MQWVCQTEKPSGKTPGPRNSNPCQIILYFLPATVQNSSDRADSPQREPDPIPALDQIEGKVAHILRKPVFVHAQRGTRMPDGNDGDDLGLGRACERWESAGDFGALKRWLTTTLTPEGCPLTIPLEQWHPMLERLALARRLIRDEECCLERGSGRAWP